MPRVDDKTYWLDERPIEMLTPQERQDRFELEVGVEIAKLTELEVQKLRKAYMLFENKQES